MHSCPICLNNCEVNPCPICGFDETLSYEALPTLSPVTGAPLSISGRKAAWDLEQSLIMRCESCGCPSFLLRPSRGEAQCTSCGRIHAIFQPQVQDTAGTSQLTNDPAVSAVTPDFYLPASDLASPAPFLSAEYHPTAHRIAAGYYHTVFLLQDGRLISTGDNSRQQREVTDWRSIVSVYASARYTLGVCADGTVKTAGSANFPLDEISSWRNIQSIAPSSNFCIGLRTDGTVETVGDISLPRIDWYELTDIAATDGFAVGLRKNGTVITNLPVRSRMAQAAAKWTGIIAVAATRDNIFGLKRDHTVVCCSSNPTVRKWNNIIALSAGNNHVVGLRSNGTLVCTGSNDSNQCNAEYWTDIEEVCTGWFNTIGIRKNGTFISTRPTDLPGMI